MSNLPLPTFKALTISYPGLSPVILTEMKVSVPILGTDRISMKDPRLIPTVALWDTGATISSITKELAQKMNLVPQGQARVNHLKGSVDTNTYFLDFYLPNGIRFPFHYVLEGEGATNRFGVIIGMDIITMGDFAVTNYHGVTTFSFRMPSLHTINYTQEAKEIERKVFAKAGRNDPCPCQSGKRYKDCHWAKFN